MNKKNSGITNYSFSTVICIIATYRGLSTYHLYVSHNHSTCLIGTEEMQTFLALPINTLKKKGRGTKD